MFCFTETKVDCIDFIPIRIKLYTKHRTRKEKKGGGLAIGHLIDDRIKLEKIETENKNALILEHSGAAIALLTKKFKILIYLKYVNSQRTLLCGQFAF